MGDGLQYGAFNLFFTSFYSIVIIFNFAVNVVFTIITVTNTAHQNSHLKRITLS